MELINYSKQGITLSQEDGAPLALWTWDQRAEALDTFRDLGFDMSDEPGWTEFMYELKNPRQMQLGEAA